MISVNIFIIYKTRIQKKEVVNHQQWIENCMCTFATQFPVYLEKEKVNK